MLTARGQGGIRLTAVDEAASVLGLYAGMKLADARALVPGVTVADAAPDDDAGSLAALADWCGRYSPWSATDGDDCIRLDITGCAHLFGGEAAMLADAKRRLARLGLTVQLAIADTPAAAWAWAHYRPARRPSVLPVGEHKALSPLPVAALRLPNDTIQSLERLGLRTIGAVAAVPRGPLAKRLGAAVPYRLDQLYGRAPEPISPRAMAEPCLTRMIFAEPIGRREDIDEALLQLMAGLCADLTEKGQGARTLELVFYRVDGTTQRLAIGTSRPTHRVLHLIRLFAERLDSVDPGFGIEIMVLEAVVIERLTAAQAKFGIVPGMEDGELASLVDRLQNRLGRGRVARLVPVESHVPERAELRAPMAFLPPSKPGAIQPRHTLRPVTLFVHPEPIEATAPVPDDPPLSFRWRRIIHRVVAADGPERIGPEWWKAGSAKDRARDYYRVEDEKGRRYWVYREGLYGAANPPRWFLHGLFP